MRVGRSLLGLPAFTVSISSSMSLQGPIFGNGGMLRWQAHSAAPDRVILRTVFRDAGSSRPICLRDVLS